MDAMRAWLDGVAKEVRAAIEKGKPGMRLGAYMATKVVETLDYDAKPGDAKKIMPALKLVLDPATWGKKVADVEKSIRFGFELPWGNRRLIGMLAIAEVLGVKVKGEPKEADFMPDKEVMEAAGMKGKPLADDDEIEQVMDDVDADNFDELHEQLDGNEVGVVEEKPAPKKRPAKTKPKKATAKK
jgi:hypothetical protein